MNALLILPKILFTFLIVSCACLAQGQSKSALKINPINLAFRTWNITYDRIVSKTSSIQFSYANINGAYVSRTLINGELFTLDYKINLISSPKVDTYVAPYFRYQDITFKDASSKIKYEVVGGGIILGREYLISGRMVFDVFGGLNLMPGGYKTIYADGSAEASKPITLYGIGLRAGILFGIKF